MLIWYLISIVFLFKETTGKNLNSNENRNYYWSSCSRSCGGGVSFRICSNCEKEIKLCNMHSCKSNEDFRQQQCSQYDTQLYNNEYHIWKSSERQKNCSLLCRSMNDTKIEVQFLDKVIDGTRCSQSSFDICVDGTCMSLGCDYTLGSAIKLDDCGVCGGNGSSCSNQSHFSWSETPYSPCSVPCGGGSQMMRPICLNQHTKKIVDSDLCGSASNMVERIRKCNSQPCSSRWEMSDWGPCSVSCGNGSKKRNVLCILDENGEKKQVDEKLCKLNKLLDRDTCKERECPYWSSGIWSQCSVTCGKGFQIRNVLCKKSQALPSNSCNYTQKPLVKKSCIRVHCSNLQKKIVSEWLKVSNSSFSKHVFKSQQLYFNSKKKDRRTSVSSNPSYIVDEWSSCQTECGEGLRHRNVSCKILLEFSKTVATLHDKECSGIKPITTEICYSNPCPLEIKSLALSYTVQNDPRDSETLSFKKKEKRHYFWKEFGFTKCSASCLGGLQESKIICVEKELEIPVAPNNCRIDSRPDVLVQTCNDHPCPPRWNVSEFSNCTRSCGGGLQFRFVKCIQEVRHGDDNILIVEDHLCPQPPPITQQFCNVIDCPIQWNISNWTKCSTTCNQGIKYRKVNCQQLLALGVIAEKPDSECSGRRPEDKQSCNIQICHENKGIYSRHHYEKDHGVNLTRIRHKHHHHQLPYIRANYNQNYIQRNNSQKMIKLKIGGKAAIFRGTKINIRCPVRKFDRSQIQWGKKKEKILKLKKMSQETREYQNVFVTQKGELRIKSAELYNTGVYTCYAKGSTATIELLILQENTDNFKTEDISDELLYSYKPRAMDESSSKNHESSSSSSTSTSIRSKKMLWQSQKNLNSVSKSKPHKNRNSSNQFDKGKDKKNNTEELNVYWSSNLDFEDFSSENESQGKKLSFLPDYVDHPQVSKSDKTQKNYLRLEWRTGPWSLCSHSCDEEEKQQRNIDCILVNGINTTIIPKVFCSHSKHIMAMPIQSRKCTEIVNCPRWYSEPWNHCSEDSKCIAHHQGFQTRIVKCGILKNDGFEELKQEKCELTVKPTTNQTCFNSNCFPLWSVTEWNKCNVKCGQGIRKRELQCIWSHNKEKIDSSYCKEFYPNLSLEMNCYETSCVDCVDTFKYCEQIKSLNLCVKDKFKKTCCHSCSS